MLVIFSRNYFIIHLTLQHLCTKYPVIPLKAHLKKHVKTCLQIILVFYCFIVFQAPERQGSVPAIIFYNYNLKSAIYNEIDNKTLLNYAQIHTYIYVHTYTLCIYRDIIHTYTYIYNINQNISSGCVINCFLK